MAKHTAKWKDRPDSHDFGAALNYLTLQFRGLRRSICWLSERGTSAVSRGLPKDILRACDLPLLRRDELHVADNIKRIHKGKALSPIILVLRRADEWAPVHHRRWVSSNVRCLSRG